MAVLKRQLHLWHRWLGIVLGLLVLLWFGSGIVMMYVPYPSLTDAERQQWLLSLDGAAIHVSAGEAWQATGLPGMPSAIRLTSVTGRPAYHFESAGRLVSVWADTGTLLRVSGDLAASTAQATLAAAAPTAGARAAGAPDAGASQDGAPHIGAPRSGAAAAVLAIEQIGLDQWTFGRVSAHRPLYRVTMADDAGTMYYVSGRTGELVRDTTRSERAWNWAGTVIHWLYFTPLREQTGPWRQAVMWSSGVAFALGLTGMVLGIQRLRLRRPYKGGRYSPYKGWQAWHHWLGLGAGTLTITWLFSGWLSVTPFDWLASPGITKADRMAFAGGGFTQSDLAQPVAAILRANPDVLELEWRRVAGETVLATLERNGRRLLDTQTYAPAALQTATLLRAAQSMRPNAPLHSVEMLAREDNYYYSHHGERPFPVLRVRFDVADGATFYIDPSSGQLAAYADNHTKWNRWLFSALHQFDFIRSRPAWDILVAALCLLGIMLSATGVFMAWRRLRGRSEY